jgi:hypothetical protein
MTSASARTAGQAVVKRITGSRPRVFPLGDGAAIVGIGVGALADRLLRSGG